MKHVESKSKNYLKIIWTYIYIERERERKKNKANDEKHR